MLKTITLAALAVVSMSAFAQSDRWNSDDNLNRRDATLRTIDENPVRLEHDLDRAVRFMSRDLSAGDRYYLQSAFQHMPANTERALVAGLYNTRVQAVALRDQYIQARMAEYAANMPSRTWTETSSTTTTATNGDTTVTRTVTTYEPDAWDNDTTWNNVVALDTYDSMRPMRMLVRHPGRDKDISYLEAANILSASVNDTTAGQIHDFFMFDRDERTKDIMVRLIEANAKVADPRHIYPSTLMPPAIPLQ